MKIIINGKTAILRKGTSFKFVSENYSVMLLWGVIRSGFLRVGGNEAKSVYL
mgnify:CR=1 FL=1